MKISLDKEKFSYNLNFYTLFGVQSLHGKVFRFVGWCNGENRNNDVVLVFLSRMGVLGFSSISPLPRMRLWWAMPMTIAVVAMKEVADEQFGPEG